MECKLKFLKSKVFFHFLEICLVPLREILKPHPQFQIVWNVWVFLVPTTLYRFHGIGFHWVNELTAVQKVLLIPGLQIQIESVFYTSYYCVVCNLICFTFLQWFYMLIHRVWWREIRNKCHVDWAVNPLELVLYMSVLAIKNMYSPPIPICYKRSNTILEWQKFWGGFSVE